MIHPTPALLLLATLLALAGCGGEQVGGRSGADRGMTVTPLGSDGDRESFEVELRAKGTLRLQWSHGLESSLHDVGPTPAGAPMTVAIETAEIEGREVLDGLVKGLFGERAVASVRAVAADADERLARSLLVETEMDEERDGLRSALTSRSEGLFVPESGTRLSSRTVAAGPRSVGGPGRIVLATWTYDPVDEELAFSNVTDEEARVLDGSGRPVDPERIRGLVLRFSLIWEPEP